jgi:hypothetical protein
VIIFSLLVDPSSSPLIMLFLVLFQPKVNYHIIGAFGISNMFIYMFIFIIYLYGFNFHIIYQIQDTHKLFDGIGIDKIQNSVVEDLLKIDQFIKKKPPVSNIQKINYLLNIICDRLNNLLCSYPNKNYVDIGKANVIINCPVNTNIKSTLSIYNTQ